MVSFFPGASMKCIFLLSLVLPAAIGQTKLASLGGAVVDADKQEPIPAAMVRAVRSGLPPLSRHTRTGGDGAYQIDNLPAGTYSVCVQTPDDAFLDPCQWNGSPTTIVLDAGQTAAGVSFALTAGSVLDIQVRDEQKVFSQLTKDGRRPELSLGVWGPDGLYHPARLSAGPNPPGDPYNTIAYRLVVPPGAALKLQIASRDLRLGDAFGAALPGNTSQQTLQQSAADAGPRSFAFILLGVLP
jgi:hypothetical protein